MKKLLSLLVFTLVLILSACQKEDDTPAPVPMRAEEVPKLPEVPYDYATLNYPAHFQVTVMEFIIGSNLNNNPITNEGATLGRVLFYDTKLSANNKISCASCHIQENGFSDPATFSSGFLGGETRRNSMTLGNTLYTLRFFWDHRTNDLSDQVLLPIQDELEMGSDLDALTEELSTTSYYPALFEAAFGNDTISSDLISNALTQFVNSMTAHSSKYDAGFDNGFSNFTAQEEMGRVLFFESGLNCNQCHTNANFMSTSAMNNGLIHNESDLGQMEVTQIESDKYQFRVPTIRNIALTAPYMHDGRFDTLEEVLDHYSTGIQSYPNLDDRLTTTGMVGGPPRQMNLTDDEKAALIAFMGTLTDEVLVTDERWSDPF